MADDLNLLCVTRAEPHALRFLQEMRGLARILEAELVVVLDGGEQDLSFSGWKFNRRVTSTGDIGSVLDQALEECDRSYVLRIDDDERCSTGMINWLIRGEYQAGQHWKFPRAHLWRDEEHMLRTPHLWPDHQTRLSWKKFSGNRKAVHAGSPYGGGVLAPCAIEHHKFLVRTLTERRAMVAKYDRIQPGAGSNFRPFSVPEDVYTPEEIVGAVRPWDGFADI